MNPADPTQPPVPTPGTPQPDSAVPVQPQAPAPFPPVQSMPEPLPASAFVTPAAVDPATSVPPVAPQPPQVTAPPAGPILPEPAVLPQQPAATPVPVFSPPAAAVAPPVQAAETGDKSFVVAWILNIFLGTLGADRFYLGYIGTGVLKLVTAGGLGIWNLIDLIRLLSGSLRDKTGHELNGRKQYLTLAVVVTFVLILIELATSGFWLSLFVHAYQNAQKETSTNAVITWANDTDVENSYNALADELNQTALDASTSNLTALRTDCQNLQNDVTAARKLPAGPPAIAADFKPALDLAGQGAQDCAGGIDAHDTAGVNKGISELDQAAKHLQAVSDTITKYRASS